MPDQFDQEKARSDFLIAMYNQLLGDINRHIVVVWQSIATLVGAFAAWSLVEKNIISLDIAVTLIVVIAAWVVAHVYDASYWYNRNLVIIANIERQFLKQSDLKEIHYYWSRHRATGAMITHLELQLYLALGLSALVLGIHFFQVMLPLIVKWDGASFLNFLPWLAAIAGLRVWGNSHLKAKNKYETFLQNSPGKPVDDSGVVHGAGHPVEKN